MEKGLILRIDRLEFEQRWEEEEFYLLNYL
jgi:hypothetical protein